MAKKQETALAVVTEAVPAASTLVETVDKSWLAGVDIEQIVTLEPGQGVRGVFRGQGAHVEINDNVTGEIRDLPTWRIEVRPGVVVRLMNSYQLGQEFKSMEEGARVRVIKLEQTDTRRGNRVNQFIVAKERE